METPAISHSRICRAALSILIFTGLAASGFAGVLTSTTFNGTNPWPNYAASGTSASVVHGISATGTIDTQQAITDANHLHFTLASLPNGWGCKQRPPLETTVDPSKTDPS